MDAASYFEIMKTKHIICWGSGKHFRNITCPFLCKSGLIENLRGFVGTPDTESIELSGRSFDIFGKEELAEMEISKTIILIAVAGYEEILSQLRSDARLAGFEAVPSIEGANDIYGINKHGISE